MSTDWTKVFQMYILLYQYGYITSSNYQLLVYKWWLKFNMNFKRFNVNKRVVLELKTAYGESS